MEASELRRLLYVAATRARGPPRPDPFGKSDQGGRRSARASHARSVARSDAAARCARRRSKTFSERVRLLVGSLPSHAPGRPLVTKRRTPKPIAASPRSLDGSVHAALLLCPHRRAGAGDPSPSGLEHVPDEGACASGGSWCPPDAPAAWRLGSAVHRDTGALATWMTNRPCSVRIARAASSADLGWPDLAAVGGRAPAVVCWAVAVGARRPQRPVGLLSRGAGGRAGSKAPS